MLIKILFTPESARRISKAFLTVSGVAPLYLSGEVKKLTQKILELTLRRQGNWQDYHRVMRGHP